MAGIMIDRPLDVVVTGLFIHGAADMRYLSLRGYSVCGVNHSAAMPGMHSRHGIRLLCPDPLVDEEAWVEFMEELGRASGNRPALVPTSDRYVLAIDRHAERLSRYFRFHGFGSGLRSALTSKRGTFALAERHGFPMPRTLFVTDRDQLAAFFEAVGGPVLLKPEFSMHWQNKAAKARLQDSKVLTADSLDALLAAYDRAAAVDARMVAQELIPGPEANQIYWAGFVGPDSEVRGRIVGRKVRVLPIHYGSGSFVELVDMPEVEAQCAKFVKDLGYVGRCGIDLKIDPRDGKAKLIEVNPRSGLWEEIGVPVGVELAYECVASLYGADPPPRRPNRFDYRWVHIGRDLGAFRRYHREGTLGFGAWIRSLKPPILVSDFPVRDDLPYCWANLKEILGGFGRRLRKRKAADLPASDAGFAKAKAIGANSWQD